MKDKIKEINITEVTNGYIVRIGCCVFVFKQGELIEELTEYIREPRKTEIRYMKEYGIRDDLQPVIPIGEPSLGGFIRSVTALNHPGEGRRENTPGA